MADQAELPDADELLDAKPSAASGGELPDADDLLNTKPSSFWRTSSLSPVQGWGVQPGSAEMDQIVANAPMGKILSAFGEGAKEGWGVQSFGLSKETEDTLKKAGIFDDLKNGQTSLIKQFNESIIRPAAAVAETAYRSGAAVLHGVGAAAIAAGLPRDVGGILAGEEGIPSAHFAAAPLPPVLAKARSLNVIGEGEAQWKGTLPPETPTPADTTALAHETAKAAEEAPPITGTAEGVSPHPPLAPNAEVQGPPVAPDIHAIARQIDPQTFQQYDALAQRRETFNRWIDELGEGRAEKPEAKAAQATIDDILGKAGGVEEKLTKGQAARLDDARAVLDRATSTDTADMARVRADLQKTDLAMRDIAATGKLKAAYEEAERRMPGEVQGPPEAEAHGPPEAPAAAQGLATEKTAAPPGQAEQPIAESAAAQREIDATSGTAAKPTTFTTAKGSTYEIHEDGTTTRNKAARSDAGHEGDSGPKARTERTVYVDDPQMASALSGAGLQNLGPKGARLIIKDGKASLLTWNKEHDRWGISPSSRDIPISETPGIGNAPLELWNKVSDVPGHEEAYGNQHAGNAITSMGNEKAAPSTTAPKSESVSIADRVTSDLVAAGRPHEEAVATGRLAAVQYETRAARFNGALGTAGDLYEKEGPTIRGKEKGGPRGLAQGATDYDKSGRAIMTIFQRADASTAPHEFSHIWLNDLMRDAGHELAPDSLKADAAAVRKYIGAPEEGPIRRRAHERFARAFEQYIREGIAPSQKLADVFGQFKDWLTKIYDTVKKLGKPITDDIRGVFDRMIAAPGEKPVIAPEREAPKSIGDRHEALAEHTPPERATAVADTIRQESDREAAKEPTIADELGATRGPDRGNAPAGAEADRNGNAGQPEPGPAGVGAESGTVGARGTETAREGPGGDTATLERPRPGRDTGRTEQPTDPNQPFAPAESRLVDKAGNIRLENLGTPEDVSAVIRETAERNGGFIEARRGVIPDAEVLQMADALGMDASPLLKRKLGEAFNAEEILQARKLLIQSATDTRDAAIKAATGSDADVMAYAEARSRHQMIQEQVSGVTAEAGRALRAFRALEGQAEAAQVGDMLQQGLGKTLYQMREEAKKLAALDTAQQASKFLGDAKKAGFWDMLLEYWINGLISGPATHTTYAVGNTLLAINKAGPETAAAAAFGTVARAMGREGGVRFGEVPAQIAAAIRRLPASIEAAGMAAKTGVTTLLPGETARTMPLQPGAALAIPGQISDTLSWHELAGDTFAAIRGLRDGIHATATLIAKGGVEDAPLMGLRRSALGSIPDIEVKGVNVLPIGTALRLPGRGVAAIHSFFRTTNYSMAKAADAYRTAVNEGLTGNDFAARIGDIITNPTEEGMASYRSTATDLTLMSQGSEFVRALSRLTNARPLGIPMLKFIDPFVHIGANVIDQAVLQRSPAGFLSGEVRANIMGRNGAAAQDMAVGRMVAGTGLAITIGGLAAEGLVTGSGPSDPKEANIYHMVNGPAHSIRVGDTFYDVHRLGPLGMQIGIAADMYEVGHSFARGDDMNKVGAQLIHAFTQNILDESFMRGPSDLIKAVTEHDRYGASYVRNMLSSFTPYSVGMSQVARAIDPYSREARTTMDAIKAKIPWASEALLPRYDIFGQPVPNRDVLGVPGLSAIYTQRVNNDPTVQAMLRAGMFPAPVERRIRGVELTDEQHADYARVSGRIMKMRLDALVAQPGFADTPAEHQREAMEKVISSSREAGRRQVMMESYGTDHNIAQEATANKVAKLQRPARELR